MPNTTITDLPAVSALTGSEPFPIDQGAMTKKATPNQVLTVPVTATGSTVARTLADRFADIYNVKDFGVAWDGVIDDATALNEAILAVSVAGGGILLCPRGVCLVSATVYLQTGVFLVGQGRGVSTIKLANGVNTHLMLTANFLTLVGTNTAAGTYKCGISGLTLDGNSANQSVANPANAIGLGGYGKNMHFSDILLKNIEGHAIFSDGYQFFESGKETHVNTWQNIAVNTCGGDGLHNVGPSDAYFADWEVIDAGQLADDTYYGFYNAVRGSGRFVHMHAYHSSGAITNRMKYAGRFETSGNEVTTSHFEGGRRQLYVAGSFNFITNSFAYAPFSNNAQIVVDGFCHTLDLQYQSQTDFPSPVVLQIGNGNNTFGYDVRLTAQVFDVSPKNEVVQFHSTDDLGGTLKVYATGCGASPIYTGTKSIYTEGFIRQTAPAITLFYFGVASNVQLKNLVANATVSIPGGYAIRSIFVENTGNAAVTDGIKIGTTNGGTEVVAAQLAAAFTFSKKIDDNNVLLNKFAASGATTLYVQAVTGWSTANVNITFDLVQTL